MTMEKSPKRVKNKSCIGKRNLLIEAKPLPIKITQKKSQLKKMKAFATPEIPQKDSSKQPNRSDETPKPSTSSVIPAAFGTPAIVPPRKVRKAPEPVSIPEKLGLKKKQRKAFDLSQRSLDCVNQLRNYGQLVGVDPQKPKKRRKRKKSEACPQSLTSKKGIGINLPSKQVQFLRQSRAKQHASGTGTSVCPLEHGSMVSNQMSAQKQNKDDEKGKEDNKDDDDDDDPLPCSQPDPVRKDHQNAPGGSTGNYETSPVVQSGSSASSLHRSNDAIPIASAQVDAKTVKNKSLISYSKNEPSAMEVCLQNDQMEEDFQHTQLDPVDMDIEDSQMLVEGEAEFSDWMRPLEIKEQGIKKTGSLTPSTSVKNANDDNLFVRPGMSPMTCRKAKPSTTKIYATSSSRNAFLAEEMAKTTKSPGRARAARPALPVLRPGAHQPSATVTRATNPSILMPPRKPPQTECQKAGPISDVNRLILSAKPYCPLKPSTSGTVIQPPSDKGDIGPNNHLVKETPVQQMSQFDLPRFLPKHSDLLTPVKDILKRPCDLLKYYDSSIAQRFFSEPADQVGVRFKSFTEYYNNVYPLQLLNAFEELASEWTNNIQARRLISLKLTLFQHSCRDGAWDATFSAKISAREESHQLYPKEDDLVILGLPQRSYIQSGPNSSGTTDHFGHVQRSNVIAQDNSFTLNLTIRTHGNVTAVTNQPVECEVVGSMISTLREYKGLLKLKRSAMERPLLEAHITSFQTISELPSPEFPGYNEEQSRAIGSIVTAVKDSQRSPKIWVIHGPPGTGKSKTIVGLLHRLFAQENGNPALKMGPVQRRMRVLLCAPSNAAVDNLMKKVILDLKERWKTRSVGPPLGNCGDLHLVRLGNERTMAEEIKAYSLDRQTKRKTEKAMSQEPELNRRKVELDEKIEKLSKECYQKRKDTDEYARVLLEKRLLLDTRGKLSNELKQCRSRRLEVQMRVLHEAHIVFCTLNTSGSNVLESAFRAGESPFSCVIVDEASQATELETLIPLQYNCNSIVLVGDPEQLPPTVISQRAKVLNYDQSLMVRVCKSINQQCGDARPNPIIFLSKQYRMHPDICDFPSKHIYDERLITDLETSFKRVSTGWPFQSYKLFDVRDGYEIKERDSYSNEKEVKLLVILLKIIAKKQSVKVGVITPYNAQKQRIKKEIARVPNITVEVDTVDGFQGREKDCIIVSCVRASQEGGIGFLGNRQRLNVTITRAKYSLFILGHLQTLQADKNWSALIKNARKRDTITPTEERYFQRDAEKILKPDLESVRHLPRPAPFHHRRHSGPATQPPSSTTAHKEAGRPVDPRLAHVGPSPQAPPRPRHTSTNLPVDPRLKPPRGAEGVYTRQSHSRCSGDWHAPQREGVKGQRLDSRDSSRLSSMPRGGRGHEPCSSPTEDGAPGNPRLGHPSSHRSSPGSQAHVQDQAVKKRAADPRWVPPFDPKRDRK